MITIINAKDPATSESISDFEGKIGSKLPDDYKNFLLKYNGGQPLPNSFKFFSNKEDGSSVDRFLSLGKEKNSNLLKYYNNYKDRIPSDFFPIAHDAGGNLILMGPNSDDNKIYFWDHEIEADEGYIPDMSNVYLISQSFSIFINSLYEVEI